MNESPHTWIVFISITVACAMVLALLREFARLAHKRLSEGVMSDVAQVLAQRTHWLAAALVSGGVGALALSADNDVRVLSVRVGAVAAILQVTIWVSGFATKRVQTQARHASDERTRMLWNFALYAVRLLVWGPILLLMLANAGLDVNPLIASAGVGGVAIALAVQGIVKDVVASIAILADRPFVIGELIEVGKHRGFVEQVGLKSTALRGMEGERITVPNGELVHGVVRNLSRSEALHIWLQFEFRPTPGCMPLAKTLVLARGQIRNVPGLYLQWLEPESIGEWGIRIEGRIKLENTDWLAAKSKRGEVILAVSNAFMSSGWHLRPGCCASSSR